MSDDIHVIPDGDHWNKRGHVETRRCWCEPTIEWPCDECVGRQKDCWRCKGVGFISEPTALAAVVVHNANDGRK